MSAHRRLKGPLEPKQLRCRRQLHNWVYTNGPRAAQDGPRGPQDVNPSVKLPAAPQPFWLEGPLEPPVGGHLTLLYAPKSLLPNIYFPEKRYHLWRSQSSLEARTASALAQVGDDFEARRCWTKEEKRIHGPIKQDPIRYWRNHCAYTLHH